MSKSVDTHEIIQYIEARERLPPYWQPLSHWMRHFDAKVFSYILGSLFQNIDVTLHNCSDYSGYSVNWNVFLIWFLHISPITVLIVLSIYLLQKYFFNSLLKGIFPPFPSIIMLPPLSTGGIVCFGHCCLSICLSVRDSC